MSALSPELVLVGPDLRVEAIAALPERSWELFVRGETPDMSAEEEPRAAPASIDAALIARALAYAAWHALLGAILGLCAVGAVALSLLAISVIAG